MVNCFSSSWKNVVGRFPDRIALSDGSDHWKYKQVDVEAMKLASFIQERGLRGQCIPIVIDNKARHIVALLGVLLSGNYYLSIRKEELHQFEAHFGELPVGFFLTDDYDLFAGRTQVGEAVCVQDLPAVTDFILRGPVHPSDPFALFTTSGSTGKPKQVVHTHECIMEDTVRQIEDNGLTEQDRRDFFGALEFSASLSTIFPVLLSGATLVLYRLTQYGVLSLPDFWKRERITFTSVAVSTLRIIARHFPSLDDLRDLRFVCVGSEPYSKEDLILFRSKLPAHVTIQIAYAATETRTITERKIGPGYYEETPNYSVGKPVSGRVVKIVGEAGELLPNGEIGEIVVEARSIPNRYLNDAAATAKSFSQLENGCIQYATGDLGYFDDFGQLYWYGRKDFVVKINGKKVNLLESERLINASERVEEAAVIVDAAHRMFAFVTVREGFELESLLDELEPILPAHLVPDDWIVLDVMPRTLTGKINRKLLHFHIPEAGMPQPAGKELVPLDKEGDWIGTIKQIWKQELGLRKEIANDDDFFNDLGGDSLTCEVCLAELEKRTRVRLPEGTAFTYTTPGSLAVFITEQEGQAVICIPLNEFDPERKSIYFIPPYPADRRMYHRFEEAFTGEFNLFFLYYNPIGPEKELIPFSILIGKMASEITDPSSSMLLGFSFGGILSYFVSLVLQQRNTPIDCLILLDTPKYQPFNQMERGVNFVKRLARKAILFLKSPASVIRYVRDFSGAYQEYKENFISEKHSEDSYHPAQIIWYYIQNFPEYGKIDSNLLLFQCENPSVFQYQIRPDFSWQRHTNGSFKRYMLKGAHYEVLTEEENITRMIEAVLMLNQVLWAEQN